MSIPDGAASESSIDDGTPGDIFVDIAKDGTTMAGLMNSLMIAVSMGLQYGVPPEVYVSKLSHLRFEPSGLTNDEETATGTDPTDPDTDDDGLGDGVERGG